jgi:CheY-like chemotaxis protein
MRRTKPTILVVDDDENDRLFIASAFLAIGVSTVYSVESGDAAIAYLQGDGSYADRAAYPYPDFVITDLKMPQGDGFAVLEHLKKTPEWAVIPTVVLTGSQDNDDIKKAYWLGASAHHVKPSSPDGLRALVKALHGYWLMCEVPALDRSGKQVQTNGLHKLGHRFAPSPPSAAPSPLSS